MINERIQESRSGAFFLSGRLTNSNCRDDRWNIKPEDIPVF